MNEIIELLANYYWILIIITVVLVFSLIGFLVDSSKHAPLEKEENLEDKKVKEENVIKLSDEKNSEIKNEEPVNNQKKSEKVKQKKVRKLKKKKNEPQEDNVPTIGQLIEQQNQKKEDVEKLDLSSDVIQRSETNNETKPN